MDKWQEIYDLHDEIVELTEEIETRGIDSAYDYSVSSLETADGIAETVGDMEEDLKEPTDGQLRAMINIKEGLERWLEN